MGCSRVKESHGMEVKRRWWYLLGLYCFLVFIYEWGWRLRLIFSLEFWNCLGFLAIYLDCLHLKYRSVSFKQIPPVLLSVVGAFWIYCGRQNWQWSLGCGGYLLCGFPPVIDLHVCLPCFFPSFWLVLSPPNMQL